MIYWEYAMKQYLSNQSILWRDCKQESKYEKMKSENILKCVHLVFLYALKQVGSIAFASAENIVASFRSLEENSSLSLTAAAATYFCLLNHQCK